MRIRNFLDAYSKYLVFILVMMATPLVRIFARIYYTHSEAQDWAKKYPTPMVLWGIITILAAGVFFAARSGNIENNWWQGFSQNFSATALATVLLLFLLIRFVWDDDMELVPSKSEIGNKENENLNIISIAFISLGYLLLIIVVRPFIFVLKLVSRAIRLSVKHELVETILGEPEPQIIERPKNMQVVIIGLFGVAISVVLASVIFPPLQNLSFELLGTAFTFFLIDYFLQEQRDRQIKVYTARRAIKTLNDARKGIEDKVRADINTNEPDAERDRLRAEDYAIIRQTFSTLREVNMLNNKTLQNINLVGAYMPGIDLDQVDNFDDLNLSGATLSEVDFKNKSLRRVKLEGANLRKAKLNNANLWRAEVAGSELNGADLTGASLERAFLRDKDGFDKVRVPAVVGLGAGVGQAVYKMFFERKPSSLADNSQMPEELIAEPIGQEDTSAIDTSAIDDDQQEQKATSSIINWLTNNALIAVGGLSAGVLVADAVRTRDLTAYRFVKYDEETTWPDQSRFPYTPDYFSKIEKQYTQGGGMIGLVVSSFTEGWKYLLMRGEKKTTFESYFNEIVSPVLDYLEKVTIQRGVVFYENLFKSYGAIFGFIIPLCVLFSAVMVVSTESQLQLTLSVIILSLAGLSVIMVLILKYITPWWINQNTDRLRRQIAEVTTQSMSKNLKIGKLDMVDIARLSFKDYAIEKPETFAALLMLDAKIVQGEAAYPAWLSKKEREIIESSTFKLMHLHFNKRVNDTIMQIIEDASNIAMVYTKLSASMFGYLIVVTRVLIVLSLILLFVVSPTWQIPLWSAILSLPLFLALAVSVLNIWNVTHFNQAR